VSDSDPHERADWHRVRNLYRQFVRTVTQEKLDELLAGELAKAMARTCAAYDGEEETFVSHLLGVACGVDPQSGNAKDRFRALYSDPRFGIFSQYQKQGPDKRRRPPPFEAAVETCRRLRDINRLRNQLVLVPTACVLGGSTSYGRFFNTVGNRDNEPSDLDLLLVVESCEVLPAVVDALRRFPGIHSEQIETMASRAASFPELLSSRGAEFRCIFSHKLGLWPPSSPDPFLSETGIDGGYQLSVHVVTARDFDYIILRDRPHLDTERTIFDFREYPPDRPDTQRSFAGTEVEVQRESEEVEGGFVASSRVCHIESAAPEPGERFFPGQHQNLVLPEVEVRWELSFRRIYLPLYSFKVKLDERLALERVQRPFEIQNLANSHTRRYAFAPYVAARVEAK
jgi:hypothetical protein